MIKGAGQAADDFEAHPLPQGDRAHIAADYEIELHGVEALRFGRFQGVSAHGARHALAGGLGRYHEAAIGDMGAAAFLVRRQEIVAENLATAFRHKNLMRRGKPVDECGLAVPVTRQGIGFAGAEYGLYNGPDGIMVGGGGGTDQHGLAIGLVGRREKP